MKKKKRLTDKQRATEKSALMQFLFDEAYPSEGKLPMTEMYLAYRSWRARKRLGNTKLSVDGFGRLFPKHYKRGTAYWAPIERSLKCVFGVGLKS